MAVPPTEGTPMRLPFLSTLARELSGRGALDNVTDVLAARAEVDARIDALAARVAPPVSTARLVAEAA